MGFIYQSDSKVIDEQIIKIWKSQILAMADDLGQMTVYLGHG